MSESNNTLKYVVIGVLVLVVALAIGLMAILYLRKKRKAREAARQKLLEEQTRQVSYDATSPEYRNLYKKALLKASQDDSVISSGSSAKTRSNAYSGAGDVPAPSAVSTARSTGSSAGAAASSAPPQATPQTTPRPELDDAELFAVAIGSWYEHLIRHSATEYLRSMVKQHATSGISERDLVPEMRILLENCPRVPLVRWSKLSAEDKALVSKKARDLKDVILTNLNRRVASQGGRTVAA